MSVALRRFVHGASVAFQGSRSLTGAMSRWRSALATLSTESRALSAQFGRLTVTGREGALMVGRLEGRRFSTLLRTARSVAAFEGATGSRLSSTARRAFRRLDESTLRSFPDVAIGQRNAYVRQARESAVRSGRVRAGERVLDAGRLEILVRSDPALLESANRVSRTASRTKKLLYLGGAITVTGVGVAYLCKVAAEHAARNTGCFMYVGGGDTLRKCKVIGCSCPSKPSTRPDQRSCYEDSLWEKMRVANSACGSDPSTSPYCVHCDWNETDPDNVNYVDRSALPEGAYVSCESQDAMDAVHEIIAGTVGGVWNTGKDIANTASDSLSQIMRFLPYVIFLVAFAVAASIAVYAIGLFRGT